MKLSIIIPAYNEEKYIERCLKSTFAAIESIHRSDIQFEVIVADNCSEDSTVELSSALGAKVVSEPYRQISRVRNAGAKIANGNWYLFIDADSILDPISLCAVTQIINEENSFNIETKKSEPYQCRIVGGGSIIAFDDAPWFGNCIAVFWNTISRTFRWAAGSFLFCRADAFHDVGGFSQDLYAAEEIDLTKKLKRWGKQRGFGFSILNKTPHISSARKFHSYNKRDFFGQFFRLLFFNHFAIRNRKHLRFFYDGRR